MDENPAGSNNDVLSFEEHKLAIRIFRTLHVLAIILHVGLMIALIYLGIIGYNWLIVIPLGSAAWFLSLVGKRYFLNIAQSCQDDLDEHPENTDGGNITVTNPDEPTEGSRIKKVIWNSDLKLTVISLMLLVVSIWYFVGAVIGLVFRLLN